jgi:TonB family protein
MSIRQMSILAPRPSGLWPYVFLSVGGHVVIAGVALFVSAAFAGPKIDLEQKPIVASLVRLGKPRDEKLLPKKEEPKPEPVAEPEPAPTAPAPPTPAAAPVPIPTKDVKPDDTKKKDKPETTSKDSKKSLFDALKKAGRGAKAEEAEGAEDGDVNGDSAKQEGERYNGLLIAVVKRNYDVSDTIDEGERRALRAEVAIRLGQGGELLEVRLKRPSGNSLFDSAVVAAVKKAAPFGAPPPHLRDSLKNQGVTFAFTP